MAMNRPEGPAWARLHLWQIQPLRDVVAVLALIGLIWLGSVISIVTVPLLLALLLAYLVEPVVRWLQRRTALQRRGAVIVMLLVIAVSVGVPAVVGVGVGVAQGVRFAQDLRREVSALRQSLAEPENERLARRVPDGTWQGVRSAILWVREKIEPPPIEPESAGASQTPADPREGEPQTDPESTSGTDPPDESPDESPAPSAVDREGTRPEATPTDPAIAGGERAGSLDAVLRWIEDNAAAITRGLFQTGGNAIAALFGLLGTLTTLGVMLFLTAFFFFFISTGFPRVTDFGEELVPEKHRDRAVELATKLDRVVSGFVRGRLLIGLILGVFFSVGWFAVGVPLAPVIGMATGLLGVFPYAALVGLPVSIVLLALENHTGFRGSWWWILLAPTVIYQIGQLADDYMLTPSIQGKETDLDIPSIMFAVFAGGALFGIYGLLIAIPLAACLKIVVRELLWPRYRAWVRGERADALPLDRE